MTKVDEAENLLDAICRLVERHGFRVQSNMVTVEGDKAEIEVVIQSNPPDLGIRVGDRMAVGDKLA